MASGSGLGNYNISCPTVACALVVSPKALTVTALATSRVYGAADPTSTRLAVQHQRVCQRRLLRPVQGERRPHPDVHVERHKSDEPAGGYLQYRRRLPGLAGLELSHRQPQLRFRSGTLRSRHTDDHAGAVNGDGQPCCQSHVRPGDELRGHRLRNQRPDQSRHDKRDVDQRRRAAGALVAGSPYAIVPSVLVSDPSNYTIVYVNGQLTVNKAPLTITANPQSKTYGAADPALTYQSSGFQLHDTQASAVTGALSRAAGEHVAGGPYVINEGTLAAANYTIAFTGNTLTITPAPLTITANGQTKVYGAAMPTLTASYIGLVNGDTAASLSTQPTLRSTANAQSAERRWVYDHGQWRG